MRKRGVADVTRMRTGGIAGCSNGTHENLAVSRSKIVGWSK